MSYSTIAQSALFLRAPSADRAISASVESEARWVGLGGGWEHRISCEIPTVSMNSRKFRLTEEGRSEFRSAKIGRVPEKS